MSGRMLLGTIVAPRPAFLGPLGRPPLRLAGWDGFVILATGLVCRHLNPAAHAAQTFREFLVIAATAALATYLIEQRGLYEPSRRLGARSAFEILQPVLNAFSLMLLSLLLWEGLCALWQGPTLSTVLANRNWLFAWTVAAPVSMILSRRAVEGVVWRRAPTIGRRAIVIGGGEGAARLATFISEGDAPLHVVGFLAVGGGAVPRPFSRVPMLGNLRTARTVIQSGAVDLVIIALPEAASRRIAVIVRRMAGMAVDIRLAPDLAGFYLPKARISSIGGLPFLHLLDKPLSGLSVAVKRGEDLLVALLLLGLLSPLLVLIAIAIRCTSPGPVLFIQPRRGFNHCIIQVRKFRTMYLDRNEPLVLRQAVRGDPRVTPLGRMLRRASLDELPQLFNVIGGSMALVGPRPHALNTRAAGLSFETAAADYAARHRVKPGITGWAQVNGWRGETDTVEKLRRRVEHDLHYIDHWSLGLDLRILVMTVVCVFRGGAY
jgi:polysaccharide biosynthesis protein PslA